MLIEEQEKIGHILGGTDWSGRYIALHSPDLLINLIYWNVGMEKLCNLGVLLAYAHDHGHSGRKAKKAVNVEELVTLWVDVLVALGTAHGHAERSDADERTDQLLGPLLTAPIKQVREFAQALSVRLEADERVPFLIWSTFKRMIAPLILLGPEGKTIELKTQLAREIAELVEHDLPRADLIASMAAALAWRSPQTLEKVKTQLQSGRAKPRMRGGESCLFLVCEDEETGTELAQVVL